MFWMEPWGERGRVVVVKDYKRHLEFKLCVFSH